MKLLEHFKELSIYPQNAKELKGLILQLAIQGKLTAQWRNTVGTHHGVSADYNAKALLEQIKAEKAQLIADKKIKKEKPLPPITQEEIHFELPKSWGCQNVQYFFHVIGGRNNQLKSKDYLSEGKHPIVDQGRSKIIGYSNDTSKLLEIERPVVVFGDHTKKVKYIDFDFIMGADGTKVLSVYNGIDVLYFYYVLTSYNLNDRGYARHFKILKEQYFPLPPLEEQKAIVQVVNTLFKEVEALEQLTEKRVQLKEDFVTSALRKLSEGDTQKEWKYLQQHFTTFFTEESGVKKLRESILQLAVQGKLTANWRNSVGSRHGVSDNNNAKALLEQIQAEKAQLIADKKIKKEKALPPITQDEIPYELPEGWEWCRFGKILNSFLTGPFGSMLHKSDYINNGIPVVNPQQMINGNIIASQKMQISEETRDRLARYILIEGDIVMARRGEMGRCAIVTENEQGYLCGTGSFFMRLNRNMSNKYIYMLFQSSFIRNYLINSSNGATMSNLNQTTLLNMIIPLSSLAEQEAIVSKVNQLMILCDNLEQEIAKNKQAATQLMQSVLREVFQAKPDRVDRPVSVEV